MNITLYRHPNRTLTALAPFCRPVSMLDEMEELAREFRGSWRPAFFGSALIPHTDVYEEKGQLIVKTELPGITEKYLEVTLEGDTLTVKADKKEEVAEETTRHTQERYYGKYVRSMRLPFPVNGEGVSATFENGVLELRLPRAEEGQPKRIEVKARLPEGERKPRQRKPRQKSS